MILKLVLEFWPQIAGVFGALSIVAGAYIKGGRDRSQKFKFDKAKSNEKTHERINRRTPVDRDDHDDIRKRLRDHGGI